MINKQSNFTEKQKITNLKMMIAVNVLMLFLSTDAFGSNIEIGFSPNQGSQDLILKTINSSKKSICMATYSFTSKPLSAALVAAQKRGVDIKIISDEKANSKKYTATQYLANQGLNVRLNGNYPIMHNKFIVVDNSTVETGSYNFSAAANKNAENVLVIWNDTSIANKYLAECNRLFNEAEPLAKSY